MANSNTFIDGFTSDGSQITTLSQVQGAGLSLPIKGFIDIRAPGKIAALFNNNGNAEKLYSINKPEDVGLATALQNRYDYKNPIQGQKSKTTSKLALSAQDANLVRKFLVSSQGLKFLGKQLILQGFQPFDETKVYNPASPLIAALKPVSFGLLDAPTRHLDTSNVIGGLVNGLGLGNIASTIGGVLGSPPPSPAPPRSSVASESSKPGGFLGINSSTFSSMIGGGDISSQVVAPIARDDVKDLLRGNTATNAYNAPRYTRWINKSGGGGLLSGLMGAVGSFVKNNTLLGGILPPTQPIAAKYRADEETYDLMLGSGLMFDPTYSGIGGGGIVSGLLSSIGFGSAKSNYSQAVHQRFYGKSKITPDFSRLLIVGRLDTSSNKSVFISITNKVGVYDGKAPFLSTNITTLPVKNFSNKNSLKYGDVIGTSFKDGEERSDQLLNYQELIKNSKDFKDQFTDGKSKQTTALIDAFYTLRDKIAGTDPRGGGDGCKYLVDGKRLTQLQFSKFHTNKIGMVQLVGVDPTKKNSPNVDNLTYQGLFRVDETTGNKVPTRLGESTKDRYIAPTNNVDYVNALEVMSTDEFKRLYSETTVYGTYGPDIIKFFFYDIINKKYIPFSATVKSITDNNSAEWEKIEYLGRPDKLYYYKGFTRSVSFNFSVVAHSVKELVPMWNRINYLVGLTRPSNYTNGLAGGFMISPMVQLTLGDFYKKHNVIINSCNVSIPEDAGWETIPEEANDAWYFGPDKAITWMGSKNYLGATVDFGRGNSTGRVAQFPRVADIQIEMNVLEKDRPSAGRAIWGDAPWANIAGRDVYWYKTDKGEIVSSAKNDFSTKVRDGDMAIRLALARNQVVAPDNNYPDGGWSGPPNTQR